jgi:hypothetical protein
LEPVQFRKLVRLDGQHNEVEIAVGSVPPTMAVTSGGPSAAGRHVWRTNLTTRQIGVSHQMTNNVGRRWPRDNR